jgi:phosphohistidine phosphatase
MDRLILLRHGKAEADAPSGEDFDRALTERGRQDVALVARALADAKLIPDLVLLSPALRTTQTWEAIAPFFPDARVEPAPSLYAIEPGAVLAMAKIRGAGVKAVMVVGHNPALGQLAAFLSHDGPAPNEVRLRLSDGFPTAAAAVADFKPRGFALYTPRALGGGGE